MIRRALSAILLLGVITQPAIGQAKKKSSSKPQNVQIGTLVSLDSDQATLVLKTKAGAEVSYRLTEKTKILRDKKQVEQHAFKTGDAIVVRFRKSSVGPPTLYDLADKPSWEWLTRIRKNRTLVTIKEITEDNLHATESDVEIEYRVTEKTAWVKAGKSATSDAFKPGEKVYVSPRLLPSGGIMALAISDSAESSAKAEERAKFTVTGTVKVINVEKRAMNLHTAAGDDRDLSISEECTVRNAGKDVPLSAVHPGQTVTAHLTRNDEGEQVASKITIQGKKTTYRRKSAKVSTSTPKKPAIAKP